MKSLKSKILKEGIIKGNNVLKVDNFLNHQLDIEFLNDIGKEIKERFKDYKIDKILTIEASGIAIAAIASQYFGNIPVVFAKKVKSLNLDDSIYSSKVFSYTKNIEYDVMVSKRYINEKENILIIDDFLANGQAVLALIDIIEKAKANVVGISIVIEKSFQNGAKNIINKGYKLESLVKIKSLDGKVEFIE